MYLWLNQNQTKKQSVPRHGFLADRLKHWSSLGEPQIMPPKSIVAAVFGEDVPMRHFACPADGLTNIRTLIGMPMMTVGQVLSSVQLQAGNAAGVAAKTAARLESPDAIVVLAFAACFGVKHDSAWRAPGAAWSYGRIVRQRFLGAHRLLKSGSLLYSCWGRPAGAGGPEIDPDYLVLAQPGRYWIALGRRYWEAVRKGDVDTTTHAFLFAALWAYYGPLLSGAPLTLAPVRMLSNIHCYIKFVTSVFNTNVPDWVEANCPQVA
jgi:hypothetical protein